MDALRVILEGEQVKAETTKTPSPSLLLVKRRMVMVRVRNLT
jgi:hypothetical protein